MLPAKEVEPTDYESETILDRFFKKTYTPELTDKKMLPANGC